MTRYHAYLERKSVARVTIEADSRDDAFDLAVLIAKDIEDEMDGREPFRTFDIKEAEEGNTTPLGRILHLTPTGEAA